MNRAIIFLALGLMMLGFVSGMAVDKSVLSAFNNGEKRVSVIIERNQNANTFGVMGNMDAKINSIDTFSAHISKQDLKELELDPTIIRVRMNIPIKAYLAQSVGIIQANSSWDLQNQGINLSGTSQSVCILDTGIDFSHPDFAGKILAEKCYCTVTDYGNGGCCPNGTSESKNASDDFGHGTHVAGIVGANGEIKGIAKNANLVIVKVMNATGDGNSLDLENGLQWCIDNSAKYNISVITASLGGTDGFNSSEQSSCNSYDNTLTSEISDAFLKNIAVTIASGNNRWTDKITWPACISDAISVGATYKNDSIAIFSNRNSLLKLFAPGYDINSTYYNGGYAVMSGTSMATPMVAGAIAVINQYLNLTERTMTPLEIENVLQKTGKNVSELGNDYSRINIYNALLSIDVTAPSVKLVLPTDNKVNLSENQTFVCNATDWQLANITLKVWNVSGGLYYSFTNNLTGTANQTSFNLPNMSESNYYWNCFADDKNGNIASASANYSLTIGGVAVTLTSPTRTTYTNKNKTNFSCKIASDAKYELSNVTFYIWNGSGNLTYNSTTQISNFTNTTIFNYTFSDEGNYSWNCRGINNGSNESFGSTNFSVTYDITSPNITSRNEFTTSSGATIKWETNEVTNSSLLLNSGSWSNSDNYVTSHSISVSGLSASTKYNYTAISCDRADNCKNISGSFITKAIPIQSTHHHKETSPIVSMSSAPLIYKANVVEVSRGYTKNLKQNEKIKFTIFNFKGGNHSLTVNGVGTNYVNLTIESKPIKLMLKIGQSKELNLTSKNYYDLFVRLDNITDGKAELTIKSISKPIEKITKSIPVRIMTKKSEPVPDNNFSWEMRNFLEILVLIIIILLLSRDKKSKKLKSRVVLKKNKQDGKNKKA